MSFQPASSPRRVAVPVLVKDGKPCSSGATAQSHPHHQTNNDVTDDTGNVVTSNGSNAISSINLITNDTPNSHSPDTSTSLLASYNDSVSSAQMLQQPCNNTIVPNSIAMAYRNQNNFIQNGHQQQCGGYLPLQGRAW